MNGTMSPLQSLDTARSYSHWDVDIFNNKKHEVPVANCYLHYLSMTKTRFLGLARSVMFRDGTESKLYRGREVVRSL